MKYQPIAAGLASLGRNGDDTLVHMSRAEVAMLNDMTPGGLSVNPHTGQPEAFAFLAPLIGSWLGSTFLTGTMGGLVSGGLSSAAAGAIGSGLATTAATGDIEQGLLAGITGYGLGTAMGGLGDAATNTGVTTQALEGTNAAQAAADAAALGQNTGSLADYTMAGGAPAGGTMGAPMTAPQMPQGIEMFDPNAQIGPGVDVAAQQGAQQASQNPGFLANLTKREAFLPIYVGESLRGQKIAEQEWEDSLKARDKAKQKRHDEMFANNPEQIPFNSPYYPMYGRGYAKGGDIDYDPKVHGNPYAAGQVPNMRPGFAGTPQGYMPGLMGEVNYFPMSNPPAAALNNGQPPVAGAPNTPAQQTPSKGWLSTIGGKGGTTASPDAGPAWAQGQYTGPVTPNAPVGQPGKHGPINLPQYTTMPEGAQAALYSQHGMGLGNALGRPFSPLNDYAQRVLGRRQYASGGVMGSMIENGMGGLIPTLAAKAIDNPTLNKIMGIDDGKKKLSGELTEEEKAEVANAPKIDKPEKPEFSLSTISPIYGWLSGEREFGDLSTFRPGMWGLGEYADQKDAYARDMRKYNAQQAAWQDKVNAGNAQGYAEGGQVGPEQQQLIEATQLAILGQIPEAEQIIDLFIQTFGQEAFMQLREQVLQSVAPGAQTQGLTQGLGAGMDDTIPGIGGGEKIAVAPGEYIVPADVVSGLGDGSTDAGAKRLDQMMTNVRQTRTGNPQQPAPIDPNKVMP